MTLDEQVTQAIQDTIASLWPNHLLTPDQQTLVEEIYWKVGYSKDLDDSLDFPQWRSQVTALEQDLTQRLASLPSPPETGVAGENQATLRFALLWLFNVAAEVAKEKFDNLPARLELYRRGLTQAAAWPLDSEPDPRVREQVLNLHYNLGVSLGQTGRVTEAIEQYRRDLTQAAAWPLDSEDDPRVRELVLKLHVNLGISLWQAGHETEAIEQERRGLTLVDKWLATGEEKDSKVRKTVFELYEVYTNVLYNFRQHQSLLLQLPGLGLWSWVTPESIAANEIVKKNWRNKLGIVSSYPQVTTAFQSFLHHLLLTWHDPSRPLRHFGFVSTATLLALSESLYGLEQARQNQSLQQTYAHLAKLADSPEVEQAQRLHQEQMRLQSLLPTSFWRHPFRWWEWQQRETHLQSVTQQLATLAKHSDWQVSVRTVKTALTTWLQTEIWQRVQKPDRSSRPVRFDHAAIKPDRSSRPVRFDPKLESLPDIVLGMLLASQAAHLKTPPEQLLQSWQENPPWQTLESLTTAFAATHWQEWLTVDDPEKPNKPVYRWTDALPRYYPNWRHRLIVSDRLEKTNRPLLQTWLTNLAQGEVQELTEHLKMAWNEVQQQATCLAQVFTALTDLHYQEELFNEEQPTSEEATYRALAAVVLGEVERQLEEVIRHWLFANLTETGVLTTFDYLKECFTRIVTVIGNRTLPALGQTVHDWAKVRLEEVLTESNLTGLEDLSGLVDPTSSNLNLTGLEDLSGLVDPTSSNLNLTGLTDLSGLAYPTSNSSLNLTGLLDLSGLVDPTSNSNLNLTGLTDLSGLTYSHDLWNLLERSRIGLLGLSFQFPQDDWAEKVGQALWQSLDISVRQLIAGHQPTDQEMWPPLQTWLQEIKRLHLLPQLPTVAECSQRLSHHEALVQPFFDPVKKWLRILWLDKTQGLLLRDLPADRRDQACWYNPDKTGLCDQWETLWEKKAALPEIDKIMTAAPVTSVADTLRQWADSQQITQLTVILPAPLGQLPWEMLEPVADLLVRTVSVAKWYASRSPTSPSIANDTQWVMGIGNLDDNLRCCNTEARWVAKQWHTQPELPDRPIFLFDALQKLASAKNIHLSTHGHFDRDNPLESGILLSGLKDDDKTTPLNILPLWLCTALRVPSEILILSACQSNLSGKPTEGLLSPLGIGPVLSAAGSKMVIGCLWSVNEVATLTFIYHLLTLAKDKPNTPWHQLATLARRKVRDMKREEIKEMLTALGVTKEDPCQFVMDCYIYGTEELPLRHPSYWAGFNVVQ